MDFTLAAMKKTYVLLSPHLDERRRRLWCAAQAQAIGHGGITKVQVAPVHHARNEGSSGVPTHGGGGASA
jgi:hypothetical protein